MLISIFVLQNGCMVLYRGTIHVQISSSCGYATSSFTYCLVPIVRRTVKFSAVLLAISYI